MFIDASAFCALLFAEPEADQLVCKLEAAEVRLSSPIAVFETVLAVAREVGDGVPAARRTVARLVVDLGVRIVGIGAGEQEAALDAFERFGKGRHPARLNMGDCFAYACARTNSVPLLFTGDDFSKTDVWIG
jgi:ribonuclease VapC